MVNSSMELNYLINIVTAILAGLVLFIFKKVIMDLSERVTKAELSDKELKEEIQDVRTNYIRRFESLNDKLNETRKELSERIADSRAVVLDKINSVQIEIVKEISQLKR